MMRCVGVTKRRLLSFATDKQASLLATFALMLVPLAAAVGAAVDYSRANKFKTSMQNVLDAALLAGARDGSTNWSNVALNYFNANLSAGNVSVATPSFTLNSVRAYVGSVTASVPTTF